MTDSIASGDPARAAATTCDKIDALDADVHAFLLDRERRARLMAQARVLSIRWPAEDARPSLFGVPVGVKDVFHVDGLATAAGSALPPAALAGPQASAVSRLLAAGALVAGKTVTTEFAMFAPGPTRNPRDLAHTPGGSSSGSAAAVAAGLVPLALGTQTIASVIRPAAFCGVAGYRPTHGRIPAQGVIPFAPSLDVVGCFATQAAGLAAAAAVLCDDWQTDVAPSRPVLGVPVGAYLERATPVARVEFARHARALAAAGYQIRKVPELADMDDVEQNLIAISRYEAAQVHSQWFAQYADLYRPATAALIRDGQAVTPEEYAGAVAAAGAIARRLANSAADAGIDCWLTPAATGTPPMGLASTGDPAMSIPWSLSGLPAIALPAGVVEGLPVAVQFAAAAGADERLLHWAVGLEGALAGAG